MISANNVDMHMQIKIDLMNGNFSEHGALYPWAFWEHSQCNINENI